MVKTQMLPPCCDLHLNNHHVNSRILRDHSDSSGIQNQVLEDLRVRLQEAEIALKHEQDAHQQSTVYNLIHLLLQRDKKFFSKRREETRRYRR